MLTIKAKGTLAFLFIFFSLCGGISNAQDGKMYPMEAPDEPNAIPLNTGGVDDQDAEESWFRQWGDPMARNITQATLTPVLADPNKATGTSIIVAPGGGFMWLSMGNEGWEVADALAAQGINAFVLKYRLQPTAPALKDFEQQMNQRFAEAAESTDDGETDAPERPRWNLANQLQDVEAAYDLILARKDEWGVDPSRIGMIGFSAGAGLTMHTTLNSEKVDLAFIGPIYGGMNSVDVPEDAPPMFAAIASDDFLFHGQFGLIQSWYDAGVPVEFHLYQNGGHGFGLGNPDRTSNKWFDAFMHWLSVNKFLVADQ
ncbi:alpha/beta hydrolase [Gilvimarinus xylanilyticus]|uniref:Alpha/beta hydrolase n=1 Tax=Gilvimarinus xylanilyticus TaxID=2944139 RepID=A0A9X2I6B4_9GAMM|nr:alpha/beta hydrolase [Gilvimarinus xylanilyticus]MCP8899657.1 alpha/beta hydrolase [Gilvimarinus xylanilyticus]